MRSTLLGLAVVATLVACGGGSDSTTDAAEVVNAPARDPQADPPATTDGTAETTATSTTTPDAAAPVEQKDPDLCGTTPEGSFTATGLTAAFAELKDAWEVRATLAANAAADAPFGLSFTTPTTARDDAKDGETWTRGNVNLTLVAKALPVGTTEKVRFSVSGGAIWCAENGTGGGASSILETSEQVKVTITSRDASTIAGSIDFAGGGRIDFKAPTAKGAAQCCPKVTLQY